MIYQLIPDIYNLLKRKDGWFTPELSTSLSDDISRRLTEKFNEDHGPPRLRMSKLGPTCPCALWHSIHKPELAEPLPPWAEIKYSFGHVIEALAITLAKAAGHHVCGEQDELELDGIRGHRDCVIDGCIVDVKSTSSLGFAKFKNGTLKQEDSFGYLDQLDSYLVASATDPLVTTKDKAYILAVDKTLGHMCLYEHHCRPDNIRQRIADFKDVVALARPPKCNCTVRPEGASGNLVLDVKASYSLFKWCCFPHLRCFRYANGPKYFTRVIRKPDVTEIDRYGRIVYNV